MRRSGYDTNLASEFYVMSVLHRLGLEAHLTLGNKKAVDIVVVRAQAIQSRFTSRESLEVLIGLSGMLAENHESATSWFW